MALILVGALFVDSIEADWAGTVTPNRCSEIEHWSYSEATGPILQRVAEMGRFNMGSTVIILLDANRLTWVAETDHIQFGIDGTRFSATVQKMVND